MFNIHIPSSCQDTMLSVTVRGTRHDSSAYEEVWFNIIAHISSINMSSLMKFVARPHVRSWKAGGWRQQRLEAASFNTCCFMCGGTHRLRFNRSVIIFHSERPELNRDTLTAPPLQTQTLLLGKESSLSSYTLLYIVINHQNFF